MGPEPDDGETPDPADLLTVRQRRFVEAICGPALGNASTAAELAGYRAENRHALQTQASRLLGKVVVQRAIAAKLGKVFDTAAWRRAGLVDLANASMENFVSVDIDPDTGQGTARIDWSKAAQAGAIGQLKKVKQRERVTQDGSVILTTEIELHDKAKALELLMKLSGELAEVVEHKGQVAPSIVVKVYPMGEKPEAA